MRLISKISIIVIFFIGVKCFSQHNLQDVEATILNFKDKKYGINNLDLLMYPNLKKIQKKLINKSRSKKCKIFIKLKIDTNSKFVVKEKIVSNCKFENDFNYKKYIESDLGIYILSIDSSEKYIEMTIPVYIYEIDVD